MYDIRIFLENDGSFGARVNAGKEIVYGLGKNQEELMEDLAEGLKISYKNKNKSEKINRLFSYINSYKNDLVCH